MLIAPSTFRRLVRARELLVRDTHDVPTVRAVAEQVGLSQFYFIRGFSALYGSTPHQLRTRARLARAQELLAAGVPVTRTCMLVGFSSLGSFSTLFTRSFGQSPTRYRHSVQVPRSFEGMGMRIPGCFGLLAHVPPSNSREAGCF
jgi:AraC-like DNA-binding protein